LGEFSPIGRLFTLGNLVQITEIAKIIGHVFSSVKGVCLFSQYLDWATFWGTFSLTHLATLLLTPNDQVTQPPVHEGSIEVVR
jgi:hypothetical protein